MKTLITLNEWIDKFPSIETIFDRVSKELKIFTILTSDEMFEYFCEKYGERDFYRPFDIQNSVNNIDAVARASAYIALYGKSHKYEYDKLVDTLSLEYNPIENYSMTEKGKDMRIPNITQTGTGENVNNASADNTATTGKTTFDKSDSFTNATQTKNAGTTSDTTNITTTNKTMGDETTTHEITRSGNIGVTTSQQMIESERKLAMFSVVDLFIKAIADIILIGVY